MTTFIIIACVIIAIIFCITAASVWRQISNEPSGCWRCRSGWTHDQHRNS